MADVQLPADVPTLYRGGASLQFKSHEVKLDRITGLLKTTHGVSVDSDPQNVVAFGGAYRVVSIPAGLSTIQRGRRMSHYEIVPQNPMSAEEYQLLLDRVELELYSDER